MAAYENVISFSQYNQFLEEEATLNPKMKWWLDPTHFSLEMGHAMMQTYLNHQEQGSPTNLVRPLNTTTVDRVIAERRAGALHWAQLHPDFLEDFEEAKTFSDPIQGILNVQEKILVVDGHKHHIVSGTGKGAGEVTVLEDQGNSFFACGWAIDEIAKRRVRYLVATIGSSVVARGFATVDREDIRLRYGNNAKRSGFAITIPLNYRKNSEPIRIFALMKDGRAVQLASQVKQIEGIST